MADSDIRRSVRDHYARIVREPSSGCCSPGPTPGGCCGPATGAAAMSRAVGYGAEDLAAVPDGANLGLGCGNPVALATLAPGEVVVDLGSGAGFDCFLAAARVGSEGRVIGVDMTAEMIERSRENAARDRIGNVEFRLGEIEHLPVADGVADAVISNCVINLSVDKARVFAEAYRVLRSGGRLMVSDLVLVRPLPATVRQSLEGWAGCVSGAMLEQDYLAAISGAGFDDVTVVSRSPYPVGASHPDASELALVNDATIPPDDVRAAAAAVVSVKVSARKR